MFFSRKKAVERPASNERSVSFFVEQLEYREMLTGPGGDDDTSRDSSADEPPVDDNAGVYDE